MRTAVCDRCRQTAPVKEMFAAFGRTLCTACTTAEVADRGEGNIPEGAVQRRIDPTLCAGCGRDNGDSPLTLIGGGVPVCPDCEQSFRNLSFPGWLKTAFAGLCVLMVVSCLGHWRFFSGYVELRRGLAALAANDLGHAVALLEAATRQVPESGQLVGIAAFARGALLLSQERPEESIPYLRKAEPVVGAVATVGRIHGEAGAAFDRKDYDVFLERSKALEDGAPSDPTAVAGVASALACKWAVSGDPAYRQQALEKLTRARQLAGTANGAFREYEGRILYRLDSREIITRAEYQRRFPAGYVPKGVSQ